jgi:hypothetical protein
MGVGAAPNRHALYNFCGMGGGSGLGYGEWRRLCRVLRSPEFLFG